MYKHQQMTIDNFYKLRGYIEQTINSNWNKELTDAIKLDDILKYAQYMEKAIELQKKIDYEEEAKRLSYIENDPRSAEERYYDNTGHWPSEV